MLHICNKMDVLPKVFIPVKVERREGEEGRRGGGRGGERGWKERRGERCICHICNKMEVG